MARSTLNTGSGKIHLPVYHENYNIKIVITAKDGVTEYNVSSKFKSASIKKPHLSGLQSASIVLDNNDSDYINLFEGGEKVEIWCEYNETPGIYTKKIYRGTLDSTFFSVDSSQGYTAIINTRQCPLAHDDKIIEQFSNALIHDAIKHIASTYLNGVITTNNVADTTVRVTTNYSGVSPWQAIADLITRAEMGGYLDIDLDLHTFESGSELNSTERVGINYNVISVGQFGTDTTKIKNKVIVNGSNENNMMIIKTEESASSQSSLWLKTEFINRSNLESMEEVQEEANHQLTLLTTNILPGGTISIIGAPLLNPGESIMTSIPGCDVSGNKVMTDITHNIQPGSFTTSLTLSSIRESLGGLFKERIDVENAIKPMDNLNYMLNSFNVFFDEEPSKVSLTNCEIVEGILQLEVGESQGECLSETFTADNNISTIEVRTHTNWQVSKDILQVSNDGGYSWMVVEPASIQNFTSTGKLLKFKIILNSDANNNPRYEAITILFK